MAFSAHNEMGQNERVGTVCGTASRHRAVNSESKVCIRLGFQQTYKGSL